MVDEKTQQEITEKIAKDVAAAVVCKLNECGCPCGVSQEDAIAVKNLAKWWSGVRDEAIKTSFSFLFKLIMLCVAIGAAITFIVTKKIGGP